MDFSLPTLDRLVSSWRRFSPLDRRRLFFDLAQVTAPVWVYCIVTGWIRATSPKQPRILASPRKHIQSDPGSSDSLPYPPDALPGARDVASPYGSIRVYEWGPTAGRKVLFIHGISTPCIAFASLAQRLVERGCRVMLFDLFGRGYSDTPDPRVYRQDMALWTAQIMTVLTSSPLHWTGSGERFTLVGYSMGGGIGANFTSHFPHLVQSLILIAPGGLLRPSRIATSSKLLYSGLLPTSWVEFFVRRRLRGPPTPTPSPSASESESQSSTIPDVAASELPSHPAHAGDSRASPFPARPGISIADAVAWQMDAHSGFLPAFVSSIQHAPVSDEHARWRLIARRCEARRRRSGGGGGGGDAASPPSSTEPRGDALPGLDENRVLILLGAHDGVIVADEIEADATAALGGEENVRVVRLEGGHDVPVVNARGCCEEIVAFWGWGENGEGYTM